MLGLLVTGSTNSLVEALQVASNSFFFSTDFYFTDLIVVVASMIVLCVGSKGQVFATSAIR